MTNQNDYYQILGLSKEASLDQIRQAYRELAVKYHPDKASESEKKESEEKFKQISEAYAVLSDPEKKAFYDQKGYGKFHEKYSSEDIFQGADFSSIFQNFSEFGLGEGLFDSFFNFGSYVPCRRKKAPLQFSLELSLEEAILGTVKTVEIPSKNPCSHCKQKGQILSKQNHMHFIQNCPYCKGEGFKVESLSNQKVNVIIPAGVDTGSQITVSTPAGPLLFLIQVKPHPLFERQEKDLVIHVKIPLSTALLGGEIKVPTLSGNVIMKIPAGTQNGKVFRLKAKGIPGLNPGDELVHITVEIPTNLTSEQKKILENFFKKP